MSAFRGMFLTDYSDDGARYVSRPVAAEPRDLDVYALRIDDVFARPIGGIARLP